MKKKRKKWKNRQKKMIKKNKLYQGKSKKSSNDEEDESNENRFTNCFKKYFASETYPTCLEFSPSDNTLMVGTSFQKILPLNSENINAPLNDKQSILQIKEVADKEDKNAEIKDIQFSPDKRHFAATDNMGRIGLFKLEGVVWSLVARYHFKGQINILSFCFNEAGTRIYTITSDRFLEEFKLVGEGESYQNFSFPMNIPGGKVDNNLNNNINNNVNVTNKVYTSIKIEDDCDMTSIVWYPLSNQKEKEIIICNDAYKIKAVNVNDAQNATNSLSIIKTSLGPCFGGPIQVMRVIPGKDKTKRLIAFATREKVLGLMCLPIDGNPFRYMGVIAHPGIIKDVKAASNNNFIFTTGGDDYTINIWKYNINPLLEAVENGGDGIKPFLNLLEGGMGGKKYKEMVDYFYYAQIKSKDENTTKHRVLDQTVAINCIHGLLASLGYYPSMEEINNIQKEVKHMKHLENAKEKSDDINFETFVKIYLNHRPYIELDVDKIEDSFENMKNQTKYHTTHTDNEAVLVRERLIECLQDLKYEEKKKDEKGNIVVELKRKVDDTTIVNIVKELDKNSNELPISSLERYQKIINKEQFDDILKDNKIEEKDINYLYEKLLGQNSMTGVQSTFLYKMGDKLISRENFIHMLKENGEKLTDEELSSILKVLTGDPDISHLPPMLSFDYIFENILLMEKEEREINK